MATSGGITTLLCSLIVAALAPPAPAEPSRDDTFVITLDPCHRVIRLDPDSRDGDREGPNGRAGDVPHRKSHC